MSVLYQVYQPNSHLCRTSDHICKSLPIHSPEHIRMAIKNFEDSVFGLSKVVSNLLSLCIVVHLHVCLYRAYIYDGVKWNFELEAYLRRRLNIFVNVDYKILIAETLVKLKGINSTYKIKASIKKHRRKNIDGKTSITKHRQYRILIEKCVQFRRMHVCLKTLIFVHS